MIKETLFYKYINEREGAEVLESSLGFIIYLINQDECFIKEMFVQEKARSHGEGKALVKELSEIALKNGCKYISANVHTNDKGASNTILSALHTGFEIAGAANGTILIIKKLGGS